MPSNNDSLPPVSDSQLDEGLQEDLADLFVGYDDDEFDPLPVNDYDIDQDDMEDDNPLDTIDYPTMRNMPEHMQREAVYTPTVQGSAQAAIRLLFDKNPARRPELLAVIDLCRDGCPASKVAQRVEQLHHDNFSVYTPAALCRMLQRAGALELQEPPEAQTREDVEDGVEYLEIAERPDPVWTSTPDALAVYDEETSGSAFWDILARDGNGAYRDVYVAVLQLLDEAPRKREAIKQLAESFAVTEKPKRFGEHFIDMLEKTYAIEWKDLRWTITDLGRTVLAEMQLAPAGSDAGLADGDDTQPDGHDAHDAHTARDGKTA